MNGNASISPYAADVLEQFGLDSFAAARWQRTTRDLVRTSDVLVFMESEHRRYCEDWIESDRQRVEVWEVKDIGPIPVAEIAEEVQRAFGVIRQRTDTMLGALGLANGRLELMKNYIRT
jgi:protein-tyrosine-phosphatase